VATAGDGFATFGHAINRILVTIGEFGGADFFLGTHRVASARLAMAIESLDEFFGGKNVACKQDENE